MRKLASIQTISEINPIDGADFIEVASVLGWKLVVKKGEFKVGDLCVYFEIDSFLNAEDKRYATFEDRFTNWDGKRGMRIKTVKLRKQISQGLALSLSQFPEIEKPKDGDDVTELLNIEKWEPAEDKINNTGGGSGGRTRPFPSFIFKTDQERVQNYARELTKHLDETFEVTIKLDGSSMTVYSIPQGSKYFDSVYADIEARKIRRLGFLKKFIYNLKKKFGKINKPEFIFGVCSRNVDLDLNSDSHFVQYVMDKSIHDRMACWFPDKAIAIQGELISPSIQNNYEKVVAADYRLFDVFDIDEQKYFSPKETRDAASVMDMKTVPVISENMSLKEFDVDGKSMIDAILAYAEGPGMNPGVKREGLVFKSNESPFSMKAISQSYLLKKG